MTRTIASIPVDLESPGQVLACMGSDYLNWFKFPSGHIVGFRTNRWLSHTGDTYSFSNTDYTPGAPTSPGTQTRTLYADQTLIGYEPGSVAIQWYRESAKQGDPWSQYILGYCYELGQGVPKNDV